MLGCQRSLEQTIVILVNRILNTVPRVTTVLLKCKMNEVNKAKRNMIEE